MHGTNFEARLRRKAQSVNYNLKQIIDFQETNKELKDAISYTISAPGKRIRSVLVLWCYEMFNSKPDHNVDMASAAIELVHTYSLVHDDLPAMDNDDFRRGVPTCHKEFDEGTAILAGDALLTLAFEVLAREVEPADKAVKLIGQLAHDAGPTGMIAGQMADLISERSVCNKKTLEYIHINKTAKMFRCAAAMGAICGGASKKQYDSLCEFGLKIGLCFQIADDILDVTSSTEELGKTVGKDVKAKKCTYPSVVGIEKAQEIQKKLTTEAIEALKPFGKKADTLIELANALLERKK
ncbi:MAG: polyprenyl synthetase family protein [Sedimentisphaerales bacterium]|nr:polyprenyl synthetase family protein [Sedimentisphaerales bacterium]